MSVNEILNIMDDVLDNAWSVPLSGGKSVINIERMRELIDDIRLNMPQEVKQAKLIVTDRKIILDDARREAETMIKVAEERARRLVEEDEITKRAKEKATEMITTAQTHSKDLKRAANEYAENILKTTEQGLIESINQVKTAKSALRNPNVK